MKFGRMVDWVGSRTSSILVNFGPGVSPQGDNAFDSHEPRVTNWLVTMLCLVSHLWLCSLGAIGMSGYTPVRITGVLVFTLKRSVLSYRENLI